VHQLIRLRQQLSEHIELSVNHQSVHWEPFSRLVPAGDAPFTQDDWLLGPILEYRAQGIELNGQHTFNSDKLAYGLVVEHSDTPKASLLSNYDPITLQYMGQMTDFDGPLYRFVEDRRRKLHGTYLQYQHQWSDHWRGTYGLRYDHYNDIGGRTTPRFAAVYAPDDKHTFKWLLSSAFRAPGLGDLYDRDSGQTIGNPNLEEITARSFEFIYQYENMNWRQSLSLYHTDSENLLSTVQLPNGNSLVSNIGKNQTIGMEWEVQFQPDPYWMIKTGFSHLFSNESRDFLDPQANVAEDFAPDTFGHFIVTWQKDRWQLSSTGHWRNDIKIIDKGFAYQLNLSLNYRLSDDWRVSLRADNITDRTNYIAARSSALGADSNGVIQRAVPQRGLSWQIAIQWLPE